MTGGLIGNTALLGVLAVTAYQDWKEQKINIYLPCAAGIAGWLLYRSYYAAYRLAWQGVYRGGRRGDADGKRHISWFLGQSGTSFCRAFSGCGCGAVPARHKKKGKELQNAVSAVSIGGILVSTWIRKRWKR